MTFKTVNGRNRIVADKDKRLTKGDGEYLRIVDLAIGTFPYTEGYYEITEEEYQEILAQQAQEEAV